MSEEERAKTRKKGEDIRKSVFDAAYTQMVTEKVSDEYQSYVDLVSEVLWGRVWGESSLGEDLKLRLGIAVFTALGNGPHLRPYLDAALTRGVESREICDIITQTALYVGFPKGYTAMWEFNEACKTHGSAGQD